MKVHFYICLIFLLCTGNVHSQNLLDYPYKVITDQNGLPSSEVYDVLQDQKGFIWFATDRGVSKFNGVSHEVFNSRNGLKGDAAFHLFKQSDTSIVCVNHSGAFYKIKNGVVKELIPEDSIKKYIGRTEFPFSFEQTPDGFFHIGTRFNHYIFDENGNQFFSKSDEVANSLNVVCNKNDADAFCYFYRSFALGNLKSIPVRLNDELVYEQKISDHYNHRSFYPSVFESYILVPLEYTFLLIDADKNVRVLELNDRILSTGINDRNLFICTDNGLYIYKYDNHDIELTTHVLAGMSVSAALQTSNGKVWISTIENGVYCFDLVQPQVLNTKNNNVNFSAFDYAHGTLITGSYRGYLSSDNFSFQNSNKRKIHSITFLNGNFHIVDGNIYDSPENYKKNNPVKTNTGEKLFAWELLELNKSTWITILGSKIIVFDCDNKIPLDTISILTGIDDLTILNDTVYVASANHIEIYSFENNKLINIGNTEVKEVSKLFVFKNALCGITKDYKLFRVKKLDQIDWLLLPKPKEFTLVTCAESSDNMLHIGTNKGVYNWKPSEDWSTAELNGFENVPNPIAIKIIQDTLFFATKKNVFRKALNDIKSELPSIEFQKVRIDGKEFPAKTIIRTGHGHQSIEIPLEFTNYSSSPIVFRYIIRNLMTDFVYTADPTIRINSLPPGNYSIEVSASVDEVNYTSIQKAEIIVDLPYWRKWPFILGIIFASLLLLYLLYKIRVNKLKQNHLLQESITKLKAQALGSQLNPHMIFNVLNSIQGLVSEGEIEEANIYIARFSKFIRQSLNYLKVAQISLSEEIEVTKRYLEIEKLRFGDVVSFFIENQPTDSNNVMVPPLIIQPIIENAIKHGLMPSKLERKEIYVRILREGKQTTIEVEDNGIGFKEDFIYNVGMSVSESRIKLLNSKNEIFIKSAFNPTVVQIIVYDEN